ncbi:MAG TPA: hypothetical protein VF278_17705 [Pirellulales bacterium]
MTTFSIERSDDQAERLRALAVEGGVTPEELLGAGLREWLFRSDKNFAEAAQLCAA